MKGTFIHHLTQITIVATAALGLTGCLDGERATPAAVATASATLSLVSYTTTSAILNATGSDTSAGVLNSSVVQFHLLSTCLDSAVGQGTEATFQSTGINLTVPSTAPSQVYVSAVGFADCQLIGTFAASFGAPAAPVFTSSSPASPSRVSYTPYLKGTTSAGTSQVYFYRDAACTAPVGGGTAGNLSTSGIQVTLLPNAVNAVYSKATEPFGHTSPCAPFASYTHTTSGPAAPTFTLVLPSSPSNSSVTPTVTGTVDSTTQKVTLFSDSACGTVLVSGTAAVFTSTGLQGTVQQNNSTPIYAIAYDTSGAPSICAYMTTFVNNSIGPSAPPSFVSSTPGLDLPTEPSCVNAPCSCAAPATTCVTNASIHPTIIGANSAPTALTVSFFKDSGCTSQIGSGLITDFTSTGIAAGIGSNTTTNIYSQSYDSAGNASQCSLLIKYVNNTIAPDAPSFNQLFPGEYSNQTTNPTVQGSTTASAISVIFYSGSSDGGTEVANCTTRLGSGSPQTFAAGGIQINGLPAGSPASNKFTTNIYAQTVDAEGNQSTCTYMDTFNYSNLPAAAPSFASTNPVSPSRFNASPSVIGAADTTITSVTLYSDNVCTSPLGTGSRNTFTSTGIQITAANNAKTTVYAVATDKYANVSPCTALLNPICTGPTLSPGICTYVYETRAPLAPTLTSITPHVAGYPTLPQANNTTPRPTLVGSVPADAFNFALSPTTVTLYSDSYCILSVGSASPSVFSAGGITALLDSTSRSTTLTAQASDAAGNASACTPLATYIYDVLPPGITTFTSSLPATPSYSQKTSVVGSIGPSSDTTIFPLNDANYTVVIYSDANCQNQLGSGVPSLFTGSGIPITALENQTTPVSGAVFDIVGNVSSCSPLVNFVHSDRGPTNVTASANPDGTILIQWQPDTAAHPIPVYIVKRSTTSGGPYTVLNWADSSPSYSDLNVTQGATYYYVIASTNNTGTSFNSAEVCATINAPTPGGAPVQTLAAQAGNAEIYLNWSGLGSNTSYQLFRALNTGGPYTLVKNNIIGTSATDQNLTNNTAYFYIVVGVNPKGASVQSTEASAVPLPQIGSPTNLNVAAVANSNCGSGYGVQLTWAVPSYYSNFWLRRSNNSGSETNFLNTTSNTISECSPYYYDNNNMFSYYTVVSVWDNGFSGNSNEIVFANYFSPSLTAAPGAGNVTLTWTPNSSRPASYNISRSTVSGGPYTVIANIPITQYSYTDSGLTNGTAYFYVMTPVFSNNALTWPASLGEVSAIPNVDPGSPSNLRLIQDPAKYAHLYWTPPYAWGSFNVYTSSSAGGPFSQAPSGVNLSATDFVDTTSANGSLTYYEVRSVWGSTENATPTNIVSYRHGSPKTISATATATSVSLTWASVPNATTYYIYRSVNSGTGYGSALTSTAGTTYSDTSVTAGTGYYYYIIAGFGDGTYGEKSAEVNAEPFGSSPVIAIPSGLTATMLTANGATLVWTPVKNATSYKIYKSASSTGTYAQVTGGTSTVTNFMASGLVTNTTVYFEVSAMIGTTEYGKSNYLAVTPVGTVAPPSSITVGNQSIYLGWNTVTGATSYNMLRSTDGVTFSNVYSTTNTSFTDGVDTSALTNGQIYFYELQAVFPSTTVTSTMTTGITPGLTPNPPSGLTVITNTTGTDVNLSWGVVPQATRYNIYLSQTSGTYSGTPSTSTATPPVDILVNSGQIYYAKVSALIGTKESALSSEIKIVPLATGVAPTAIVGSGNLSIKVNWTSPGSIVTTYDLQRSTDGQTFTTLAAGTGIGATSLTDTTVSSGVSYMYRFLPYASGFPLTPSATSNIVTVGTAAQAPTQLFADVNPSNSSVALSWVQSPQAVSYNIYRSATSTFGSTPIGNVSYISVAYTDSTTSSGQTYYYMVKAVNSSGTESPASNTALVSTMNAPGTPTAVVGGNVITVSWPAVSGAASYIVRRQITPNSAGTTVGVLNTVTAPTVSYVDSAVTNGVTYTYVIDAVSATGSTSADSNPVSATAVVAMNLEVPIELLDQGAASSTTAMTFARTQTSLDPSAYDGTVTYSFVLSAINNDSVARTVSLQNGSGTVVASYSVPAGTTTPTRFSVAFTTPPTAPNTYFLSLPATTSSYQLVVYSARMSIKQVGASKTKIFIPLLTSSGNPVYGDLSNPVVANSLTAYSVLAPATIYSRNTAALSTLIAENPWMLEAVATVTSGAQGVIGLYNNTRGAAVLDTETILSSPSQNFIQVPFADAVTNFAVDGDQLQISTYCQSGCGSGQILLYKAGLWVTLTNLSKVEVYFRSSPGVSTMSTQTVDGERTRLTLTNFSNPAAYFQAVGYGNGSDSSTVALLDTALNDSGSSGQSVVAGSTVTYNSATPFWQRSGALTLTTGDRFLPQITAASSGFSMVDSTIVIDAHP